MKSIANSIKIGLKQAIAHAVNPQGQTGFAVHIPATIDVKAIRTKLGMSQQEFAGRFRFSVNTLRHWEQGKRTPEGSARAYLLVIDRAPDQVEAALRAA